MPDDTQMYSVGIIGARGYVGRELLRLIEEHPALTATLAVSRRRAGERVAEVASAELRYTATFDPLRDECPDILVLGLPDGHARTVVEAIDASAAAPRLIIDLSADYRFDDQWVYSVPELHAVSAGAARIANPGCYATAMQLAVAPIKDQLASTPYCFGVSGYTGAGTKPSEKNDAEILARGVLPYTPVGHAHEREVSRHLGREVRFAPCVAGYPRGITLTALVDMASTVTAEGLISVYETFAAAHPLISVTGARTPRVQEVVGTNAAIIGGISVDAVYPTRAAIVCVIDNLLKGAASQALQNINLALGLDPVLGVSP